jgi:hypothetical protein
MTQFGNPLRCSGPHDLPLASGKIAVPVGIANWLEAWVTVRQAHPDPLPPDDWHQGAA